MEPLLSERLRHYPVVAILGPRQVGKTTLAKAIMSLSARQAVYLDLESSADLRKLEDAEQYLLQRKDALVIIDEVQRMPELFPILRSVIDEARTPGRFVLLGSASPTLLANSSESLAGRIAYCELHPLLHSEVMATHPFHRLWLRGGFPDMLDAENDHVSFEKREQFIQTYTERDLPMLGLRVSPAMMRNLLIMLAHLHGNLLNLSDLSRSLGRDLAAVRHMIDFLEHAFLVRRLQPFYVNISKRLVKSPKLYIRDTGLLHTLLGIATAEDLDGHPGKGNSWEGFIIQQVVASLATGVTAYFYRTQDGSELDLVLVRGGRAVIGMEVKHSNAPSLKRGVTVAAQTLGDIPVLAVTPSVDEDYALNATVTVTSFGRMWGHLAQMGLLAE
jgi:uncharacterized protein